MVPLLFQWITLQRNEIWMSFLVFEKKSYVISVQTILDMKVSNRVHNFTDSRQRVLSFHIAGNNMVINFHYKPWWCCSWYKRQTKILNSLWSQLKMRLPALYYSGTGVGTGSEAPVYQALMWNPSYCVLCEGISCFPLALFSTALPREEETSAQKGKYCCSFIVSLGAGLTLGSATPLFDSMLEQT